MQIILPDKGEIMILQAEQISKTYTVGENQIEVLSKVDFQIAEGEKIAIIGPSGSGKSTLLNLLSGLDTPDSGTVRFKGRDYKSYSKRDFSAMRLQNFGFIFQSFHLISSLNVLDNVLLPVAARHEKKSIDSVIALCDRLGLTERLYHFPHQLSGGEQQRTAIARALIGHPAILFSDEATGNLDAKNSHHVMTLLKECCEEHRIALAFVTHDMSLTSYADRIVDLSTPSA